jgi:hypothetical protein
LERVSCPTLIVWGTESDVFSEAQDGAGSDAYRATGTQVFMPQFKFSTDKSRLLAVLGISETEYVARFTSVAHTDWVMRCTARKVLRAAEQEPVVLPPAKATRAA